MSDKNGPTYIFQNQETKEIMWFIAITKLLKFLDIKELNFILCNVSGNTCQINKMLGKIIEENDFLTKFLPELTDISISSIHDTLKKLSVSFRDGWKSETNPLSIISLFNKNPSGDFIEYNREVAVSGSGIKDSDMVDVIHDDFLSKYFDKATKNGTHHKELLYYRNFNITKTSKLVTGVSNFNTEIFRSELLRDYRFLDHDMCIYDFSDYQEKDKTQALFKLITENIFLYDNKEYNLYRIDEKELLQIVDHINQQISDFLKQTNSNNKFCVEYDTETRRFLMVDEKKISRDATAYLYTTLCDYFKQRKLAKLVGKLKDFIKNEQNSPIMDKVTASHYAEKFDLVKNIAKYFKSDLLDSTLKAIEFTEEEKNKMKEYFLDKSPFEFFFKNPDEIKKKLNEDKNDNVENHPDKEDSITKYILEKNIDDILTNEGKEFLNMVKKIASSNEYFKDLIKKDKMFEQYQSQNGKNCTYKNNTQNKKTKIEFSILKALIESIDSGSNIAYQNFFVQLSYYLNYFFCNGEKLSKKELKDSIKKKIDEIHEKIESVEQKKEERSKERATVIDLRLTKDEKDTRLKQIDNRYGTLTDLTEESVQYKNEINTFYKKIFNWQNIQTNLELSGSGNQSSSLDKFKKYFLGYNEEIFEVIRPKIRKFVENNELFKDKAIEVAENTERIDIKTEHLINAIQNYLGGITEKVTYDWFNLYVNYVCQHEKIEFNKIMDAVVDQNDLEKNLDGQLDFLITDIIIEYKKVLEEITSDKAKIKSDKTNIKLINSHNNFGIMNLFHLLQSFINAGYISTYDLDSEKMCEFLYNAHEINFLISHHPKELIQAIREKKNKSVDVLINHLLQDISFGEDKEYKLIKKMCKMSVYTFSKITAAVDHMTQINMAQFFSKINGVQRKFSNGVMLDENGSVGCFMVPIQKALEICKTSKPDSFQKDINEILPKLPDGMKWANINQECDLFFDQTKYKMLSPAEASKMFCTTEQLVEKAKDDFYFFKLLIQREENQFNEFLSQNSDNDNKKNIFDTVIEKYLNNDCILSIKKIDDPFCFISEMAKNSTKFGLNATEKFILLAKKAVEMVNLKIAEINLNQNNYIANDLKKYTDMINKYAIDILINFIGKTYFTWNNIIEKSDPKNNLCEKIIRNSFVILNIAFQHIKKDDIRKNSDLILWLYLIYKKINFDSDFSKIRDRYENPLKLNDEPHFLKEYKISDGYEAISSKNIFYINDRIQEFKDYLSKNNFSDLIFFVDNLPRDRKNLTSIIEANKYIAKLLKQKVDSREFIAKFWKHKLSKLLRKTHNPEELFNVAQNDQNASHVFYAIKTLYKIQSYDKLQELLLSDNLETNVLKKLCMDIKIDAWPRKSEDERNMFFTSIEIFSDLLLKEKMKISFTSAVYLIKSIANFVVRESDNDIERYYGDICDDKYKKYFRGDKNIFSVAAEIVGQIPFPANAVMAKEKPFWPNAKENLLSLYDKCYWIYETESSYRKKDDEELTPINKNLSFRLYLLYKKIFYDEINKGNLNLDDNKFLLCEYQPDDGIEKIRQKYIFWDDYHIKDFSQWVKDNGIGNVCCFFYEKTLSEEILIEIAFNHGDCQALYNFVKKFPEKAQEYLLSNDRDNIMQKLCSLCTEKTKRDLSDLDSAIYRAEKISFRVALSAIKFIHDLHIKFRENTKTEIFKKEFDRFYPRPLGFILGVIEKIYFADEKLENHASSDEYTNFLKIVVEEIYFYEEEVEGNSIYKYLSENNKFSLIWYLYLLRKKIMNHENYILNKQSDNVKFEKVNRDYLIGNYGSAKVLNMNQIVNLFCKKYGSELCYFGLSAYGLFSGGSQAQFFLQGWIEKFKLDLSWIFLKKKIRKKEFKILVKSIQEAKAKEKTKNMLKKKYYFTLAKDLKQLRALDLLNKGITKENRKKVIDNLKKNDRRIKLTVAKNKLEKLIKSHTLKNWEERKNKIKQREKLKEMLEKRQKKIDENKKMETLKKWNEKNKKIERLNGILKKKVEQKQTADKNCEAIKLKKWNENAKKIKANRTKAVGILVNTFQKIKFQTLNNLKENDKRIKRIEAKDKITKVLQRNILKKLNDKLIAFAQNQNKSNKQKRSNAWSKTKKMIFVAIFDLVSIALAIIFLKEIIFLIAASIALAIIFIVCCGVAIKNGRDYKNLGEKIFAFEEKQLRLNILPQQQIVPGRENLIRGQNNLINND